MLKFLVNYVKKLGKHYSQGSELRTSPRGAKKSNYASKKEKPTRPKGCL